MKNVIKIGSKYIITFIIGILIFITAITAVALIPTNLLKKHSNESGKEMLKQSPYWKINDVLAPEIILDNYTDSLMVNNAYSMDQKHPFESAILVRKSYIPGKTKIVNLEPLGNLKSPEKYGHYAQIEELIDTTEENIEESYEYARYWHGYLIYLRPLLVLFNITQIRIIMTIILAILTIYLSYLLWKKLGIWTAIALLVSLACVHTYVVGFSLLSVQVFLIMLITSIIIVKRFDKIKSFPYIFFITGMLTSFFDFLSTPVITLGVPLIIYLALLGRNPEKTMKDKISSIFKIGIVWAIGYVLTWLTKWVITDLFFQRGTFYQAYLQVRLRTNSNTKNYPGALWRNLQYIYIMTMVFTIISLPFIIIKLYFMYKGKENLKLQNTIPIILVALFSFIWFLGTKQHMQQHAFFTYRTFLVFIFGAFMAIIEAMNLYRKNEIGGKKV